MLNSILKKLNGHAIDVESLVSALTDLGRERETAATELGELQVRRHQALLDDATDATLDKIERDISRKETLLQKLKMAEPGLRERLKAAQAEARKRRLAALVESGIAAAREYLASGREHMADHSAYVAIRDQMEREGFRTEVASLLPPTSNVNGNPLLATDLLDIFERALVPAHPRRTPRLPKPPKAERVVTWQPSDDTFTPVPRGASLQHAVMAGTVGNTLVRLTAQREADDLSELLPGESRVLALHSNWSPRDDLPITHAGQKIRMLASAARAAADRGQVEILEEYTPPAGELAPAAESSSSQPNEDASTTP